MIPNFDNQTKSNAMFIMATLSPKVRESIDFELYRQSADSDGSTEEYILEDAFRNLWRDLESLGVVLQFDYSDTTSDFGRLFEFLKLSSYLLPNTLYPELKSNSKLRDCVAHILAGSLGDEETLIQTYLSELGGLDGQFPLLPDLTDCIDQYYPLISQTDIFTDYMRNLMDLIHHERLIPESDMTTHQIYRDRIREFIGRLSDAVNLFSSNSCYSQLCKIQDFIILDLVAPTNFIEYNYLFVVDPNTLPEDLLSSYHQKWYHYRVSNQWCPDYFKVRNQTPTPANLIMMYCFLYASHQIREAYEEEATILRKAHPAQDIESVILPLYQTNKEG